MPDEPMAFRSSSEYPRSSDIGFDNPSGGAGAAQLASIIESRLDRRAFQQHHWEGTFLQYLDICSQRPGVVRNAYQRLYDAVLSYGFEKYRLFKKDCIRYHFFSDPV